MPSPFPGMDPYLESPALWPDFHLTFLVALRPELNKGLPAPYVARLDRYVWVDAGEPEGPRLVGKPDAFVSDPSLGEKGDEYDARGTATAPVAITLPAMDHKGKPFLQIIDAERYRVVTVIELLSPANKRPGKDREIYLGKREEYLAGRTNLVEIDLLRRGLRTPTADDVPPSNYRVIVSRALEYPKAGAWLFSVRDPLPAVPVPLKAEEPDVLLSLQACMTAAYDLGNYARELDYGRPPEPPLASADATWLEEVLTGKGLRPSRLRP